MLLMLVMSTPANATPGTILQAWADAKNRTVFVRSGTYNPTTQTGFGLAKIQQKHRINSIDSLVFVTRNPNGGTAQGDDRLYEAFANKKVCNQTTCTVTESIKVRVIMSNVYAGTYYGVVINGAIGIKTAYCVTGSTVCPSWIDQGLRRITPGTPITENVWSYEPLAVAVP